jgi:stage V sporulation protein AC
MDISTKRGKERLIKLHSPKSNILKCTLFAFLFGGLICLFGEGLYFLFSLRFDGQLSRTLVSLSLILIAALLTAVGIFDKIAKHAGAGTLVPITGFSNATVSEAIDAKSEGLILGVGAKIFTVSGPVILFGIFSGVLYGFIYFLSVIIAEML